MILAMVTDKFMAKTTHELKQLTSTELQNVTSKVNSKIGLLFFFYCFLFLRITTPSHGFL